MTTTQERAGVEGDLISRALISAQRELKELLDWQPCDHSVGVCSCSTRRALEDIEAALRQPQAARLTEEDFDVIRSSWCRRFYSETGEPHFGCAYCDAALTPDPCAEIKHTDKCLLKKIDRLTAAPAQVTREEIALWLWKFSARSSGTLKSTWESFDLSNHWNPSELLQEADGFISFLAERGLVKEG